MGMGKRMVIVGLLLLPCLIAGWAFSKDVQAGDKDKSNQIVLKESGQKNGMKKWEKGRGWGWVWGDEDEIGSLNEMTDGSRLKAVSLVRTGKVYDLGITYDRTSYKWPGHSPGEIISFRTPEGVKRQKDIPAITDDNPMGTAWHSCALFINDNVATQIDGLGHLTEGPGCEHGITDHWYNGFKEEDWGGNWGPRKCDAAKIPPIIARGILIDVAGYKGVNALPSNYEITVEDLENTIYDQGTDLRPGDVVLIRTGTLKFWGETGSDHSTIELYDSAGIGLRAAKWLVEENGTMMVGSDTSGVEYKPRAEDVEDYRSTYKTFVPVHNYLLIEQGVHIAEYHDLEGLARDKVYEFLYICAVNKIKGSTAGFTLRPIGIR